MESRQLKFNLFQLSLILSKQTFKLGEGGRGVGKSSIIAWDTKEVVHQMPRCTGIIVGATYQQILTRTLPSTIESWERMGYYRDIHYFIGRKPPKNWKWPEAYQAPADYSHAIYWYTGAVFHLVSQDRVGNGRGINSHYVVGDEAALLDEEQLNTDVLATNRAIRKEFEKSQYLNGCLFMSTTPLTDSGKWMFKYEELAKKYPLEYFYLMGSAEENKENLKPTYFRDMKRSMVDILYRAEILNERITKIEGCFYANLNTAIHTYSKFNYRYYDGLNFNASADKITCEGDEDLNLDQPLEISVDWGANINCMNVGQENDNEFRFLKSLYVKAPHILDDLFKLKFIPYYAAHRNKTVYFWYDRNGNSRIANSDMTFFEQAERILTMAGWNVIPMSRGVDPPHQEKFFLWAIMLGEQDTRLPVVRFNKENCKELIISMQRAPVKDDYKGIKKDKRSERSDIIPQEEATHFSDAADIIIYGKYRELLDEDISRAGMGVYFI